MKLSYIFKILVMTVGSAAIFLALKFGADNYFFPAKELAHTEEAVEEMDSHADAATDDQAEADTHADEASDEAVEETTQAPAEEAVEEVVEDVAEPTFADLLAVADAGAGARVFNKCKACHSAEAGENKVGPSLFGVVGRVAGTAEGFARYSDPMLALGTEWSVDDINEFITKPRDFVDGTSMTFAGLRKVEDRANVIAYLATLQ